MQNFEIFLEQVKESGVKVGIVRPGGIATPGYDHAAGSSQSRRDCPFLVVVTTIVCCCHNFFVVVVRAIVIVIVSTK